MYNLKFKLRGMTKASPKAINIVHQNIQGLAGKELEVELFLLNENINVLCVTEHWLKDYQLIFNIRNFQLSSAFSRRNAIRGGSLIFVNSCKHKIKERKDVVALSIERIIELSCVELEEFIIVCVYRPPSGNFNVFESTMEDVIKKICKSKKSIVVCGDFNVNLLESCPVSVRLTSLFGSFDLNYQFLEPTRITATSATCLDNFFCNCTPQSKSILSNLSSDHCGQKITFNLKEHSQQGKISCRPVTDKRVKIFKHEVTANLTSLPFVQDDPNALYKHLFDLIKFEFDKTFTVKTYNSNNSIKFGDWATSGLHRSRVKLYDLYEQKKINNNPSFLEYIKKYSKTFRKACACAKSLFISEKIKKADNKIKATWNCINRETGKVKPRDTKFSLKIGDSILNSDVKVANAFEHFFTNIPIGTTMHLNSSSRRAEVLLKKYVPMCSDSFQFSYINCKDVLKSFKSLKMKNTCDLWDISTKIISNIIESIAPFLVVIFNSCVDEGVFPDLMKHSKVLPLFKSGSKEDPSNFRPISILPTLSKIFEKLILDQLSFHFAKNRLFHSEQYGFTRGRSTTDAGATLLKHIFGAWEESQNALGVFCDLSKAFDCVEYNTLLLKLKHYGVHADALKLIQSYLSCRIQKVNVNGSISSGSSVLMGVPQGSILGPFLFLIYINDLPFFAENFCKIVLFADDTSLIFKMDRNKNSFDDINNALSNVLKWFNTNNLQLNAKKTKCINFTLPNVKSVVSTIKLNDELLDLVESTVFLGITLDSKIQWNPHISTLAGRLSSAAYAVRKIRQLTDEKTARLVYFSYFHSVMSYGILLWGKAADIETIFILQKRAVRSIYNLGARVSLKELFKEINILTVASQFIYNCILYVRQNISFYRKHCDIHKLNTRNKNKLVIPKLRLQKVYGSFMGQGVVYYNKIPNDILILPFEKFKTHVKETLVKKGYYNVNDYVHDKNAWN